MQLETEETKENLSEVEEEEEDKNQIWTTYTEEGPLTWNIEGMHSEDTIKKLRRKQIDLSGKRILELGFGYNRFLKTVVRMGIEIEEYMGIDIGQHWIETAQEDFMECTNMEFIWGDIRNPDTFNIDRKFDVVVAFLILSHIPPDFSEVLRNVKGVLEEDGIIICDIFIGDPGIVGIPTPGWERRYSEEEVKEILENEGLEEMLSFRMPEVEKNERRTYFIKVIRRKKIEDMLLS